MKTLIIATALTLASGATFAGGTSIYSEGGSVLHATELATGASGPVSIDAQGYSEGGSVLSAIAAPSGPRTSAAFVTSGEFYDHS